MVLVGSQWTRGMARPLYQNLLPCVVPIFPVEVQTKIQFNSIQRMPCQGPVVYVPNNNNNIIILGTFA